MKFILSLRRPLVLRRSLALGVAFAAAANLMSAAAEEPPKDYSAAERALFMTDQLSKLRPPLTLRYKFHRSGSLEPAFDDKVSIVLKAQSTGACCDASGEFLSGERKVDLPAVEGAVGNPVTLFFLERDVREMQRLTTGKSNYFRKRIRMAIFQGARQRAVTLRYHGRAVAGQEFVVTPFVDDPNRPRFERLAGKRYVFTLSDAVPGGVYAIRTLVDDAAKGPDAPPLLAEELLIEGGQAPLPKTGT
jgi:hypothetical protein